MRRLTLALLACAAAAPPSLQAAPHDVLASPVSDISVTVYRNPVAASATLDLDGLQGFALITETRTLSIPAGESRIRFEGVADGIEPASAILTGLPDGLIEKNHDAKVLSPSTLVAAAVGHRATFVRTNPTTGQTTEIRGTLQSDAAGVVFQSDSGAIEALRCSGLPETFDFEPTDEVQATPTLSALVRTPRPVQAQVRLSYLARGFDWKADYTAQVGPGASTLSLGAWVTLANSNSVSFQNAHASVVAGRLNRVEAESELFDSGGPIRADCWPRGSTSDRPKQPNIIAAEPLWDGPGLIRAVNMSMRFFATSRAAAMAPLPAESLQDAVIVTAEKRVTEEQLGDLKLYRVPDRTSVVSRQIKQVRLLDRADIPIEVLYRAELEADTTQDDMPLAQWLRTQNTGKNNLGLALPAGRIRTFELHNGTPLLLHEARLNDTAVNEDVELNLGDSDDVRLSADTYYPGDEGYTQSPPLPRVPGVSTLHRRLIEFESHINISNARSNPVQVEITLLLDYNAQVAEADPLPTYKNGNPVFKVTVPPNARYTVRYKTSARS